MFTTLSPLFAYAIELTACSAILWLFYKGVVSKSNHLGYARTYLLLLPLVSIFLPLISISVPWSGLSFFTRDWFEAGVVGGGVAGLDPTGFAESSLSAPSAGAWTWVRYLLVAYVVGVLAFWLRIALQCGHVGRIALLGQRERHGIYTLVYSAKVGSPFSFLSTIYLPLQADADEKKVFIRHETEHIRYRHSYDILFLELAKSLFWFNPFLWKTRTALRDVHEYQVDRAMVQGELSLSTYKIMIMKELFGSTPEMAQGFGHSLLKKRMLMLGKAGQRKNVLGRTALLLPLLAGLMFLFCCKSQEIEPVVLDEPLVEASSLPVQPAQPEPVAAAEATKSTGEEIAYVIVDEKPLFEGKGANAFTTWVNSRISYPDIASEKGIQGKVTLSFLIDVDGSLKDIKVLRSVDPYLDNEAIRVVSTSPKWTPGKQGGKVVKVRYSFPIHFQLQ